MTRPGITTLPAASIVWAALYFPAIAADVSTATISAPLMATAPGLSTRRAPSTVMTMPLVMTRLAADGCSAKIGWRAIEYVSVVSATAIARARIDMLAELYVNR